jgi:hypothetical protein
VRCRVLFLILIMVFFCLKDFNILNIYLCDKIVTNLAPSFISFYDILQPEFSSPLQLN